MADKVSKFVFPVKTGDTIEDKEFDLPSGGDGKIAYRDELLDYLMYGSAVVYNDEIHILGGTNHYKWNGSSWVSVSTLPYNFTYNLTNGSAVVYNNEIHILGGGDNGTNHYKWDGSSWSVVSTLPYEFYSGSAVVYSNEIHILGGGDTKHYKWDGSSWVSVSTLPYNCTGGSAVVYNNEIHILGGRDAKHYKWDGSSWVSVSTLPYNFTSGSAVVFNNEIHILGGWDIKHYKWDGSSWVSVSTLPYNLTGGSAVVYNNEIHILGSEFVPEGHCKFDGTSWTNMFYIYADDRYYTESEIDTKLSKTEVLTSNIQQSIAPIQTTRTASKNYAVGEQFVYNGLLYSVTTAIASGGRIIINGNCKLADTVTNQILLLTAELNKLKNATRRTQRNITTDLTNLPTAVAEQNLEKYGYTIGDYFIGNSGYTYFLADMNTFRGANNDSAVINQNHISIVVKTGADSKWNETDDTSTGYSGSVLHSYLSGTVLNNIKSDMIALFGGSTGLEHLLSHKLLWTTAVSSWEWSEAAQYISALTEPQVYGTNVWAIDGYQTGEAWKHLELFKKFSYMEVLGWFWFWLRSIRSASYACNANDGGAANDYGASISAGVVGLIVFK